MCQWFRANFDWWELPWCVGSSWQILIGGNCYVVSIVQGKFGLVGTAMVCRQFRANLDFGKIFVTLSKMLLVSLLITEIICTYRRHWYLCFKIFLLNYFINWDLIHARLNTHCKLCSYRKKNKMKNMQKSCLERTQRRVSINYKPTFIQIIGQRKAFYRQGIPQFSCTRKKTVDIDILITSRNSDRKIMEPIRVNSGPLTRIRKWNQFTQFRYESIFL